MEIGPLRDAAIVALLAKAGTAALEDLGVLVAAAAREAVGDEAVVYVADYEQRRLLPLSARTVAERAAVMIDGTVAGRAFQTQQTVAAHIAHGVRLWVPMSSGAERLGVLEVCAPDTAEHRRYSGVLAGVTALLLISRRRSSDHVDRIRRRERMSLAAEIQWTLLPPLTYATQRIMISGVLEPSYEIAGDSFDYAVDDGIARVAIFDAMGHGLEATRMAMLAVGAYRHARREGGTLEDVRAAVDEVVARTFDPGNFVTAQFGELDGRTGALRWLNCGHPEPLLIRRQSVIARLACAPTLPLGLGGDVAEIARERLEPGDRMLLFTDGVTDARSSTGSFFGEDRLDDFVGTAELRQLPVPETLRQLAHALVDYQDGTAQDDATMVMLEWRGPGAT